MVFTRFLEICKRRVPEPLFKNNMVYGRRKLLSRRKQIFYCIYHVILPLNETRFSDLLAPNVCVLFIFYLLYSSHTRAPPSSTTYVI